jgi:bifunctional non-homologous end joining protein LigD
MGSLDLYRAKRNFRRTSEPSGQKKPGRKTGAGGAFVIHKHAARRLHYDLRLEHGGVLWSWAVTRGPSLDPDDKRLAVHVEDHPLDYGSFEGMIPKGQYGAGAVIVWDEGRWEPEGDPVKAMAKGHISFTLEGHKLRGGWHLVRLAPRRGEKRDNWLLIKAKDEAVSDEDILAAEPASVASGRTIEDIEAGKAAPAARAAKRRPVRKARQARSDGQSLPAFVEPCLAALRAEPVSGDDWIHEVKFDGYRIQARIEAGEVQLLTRTGLDWTERFGRDLAATFEALPCESALIDGEVVVLNDKGISSFAALQAALSEGRHEDMVFFAFDLLHLDGEDLRGDPLLARKERLAHLLDEADSGPLRYSEHFAQSGRVMLDHACRLGLEGVVSKRVDAPYQSGRRGDWVKSKCIQSQEFVIIGYVPSRRGNRGLGSLVVGYRDGKGQLVSAGRVGTGFTGESAAALKETLDGLKTARSPLHERVAGQKDVIWVEPKLVAEVEFRTWTADKQIRQASFKGLREDKPAEEVVIELPRDAGETAALRKTTTARREAAASTIRTSVKLSNADKVLWPETGLTKAGLLDYYASVWSEMKPFVTGRPLSLLRAPDGVTRQTFFQKHAGPGTNPAIRTLKDPEDGEQLLFIEDFDGLAALVQLGVVEIHVWGSTVKAIEKPDQVIFDLDPDEGLDIQRVRDAAIEVRDRLTDLGFTSFLKTSGGKGFHVTVPLKPQAEWPMVKTFARDFAKAMEQADPKLYTATLSKQARKGRVFIDYLRNTRGATAIVAYSTRAKAMTSIAAPVAWQDLERGLKPDAFRVDGERPDPKLWADFFRKAKPLQRG